MEGLHIGCGKCLAHHLQTGIFCFHRIGFDHEHRSSRCLVDIQIDRVAGAVEGFNGAPALLISARHIGDQRLDTLLQRGGLFRVGQSQLHQLLDLAIQSLPADGRLVDIDCLSLKAWAGLLQQVGKRALVLLTAQQGQQVFLLKCELASQLPVRIGRVYCADAQKRQQYDESPVFHYCSPLHEPDRAPCPGRLVPWHH